MHGRHLSGTLVFVDGQQMLVDCGEGTQYQLQKAPFKPNKLSCILISHLHGDHWYGLPGLLSSLSLHGRKKELILVCPKDLPDLVRSIPGLLEEDLSYHLKFVSLGDGDGEVRIGRTIVRWEPLDHPVHCVGFRITESDTDGNLDVDKANKYGLFDFEDYKRLKAGESVFSDSGIEVAPSDVIVPGEKGRVFGYVLDTRPCDAAIRLGENADLLLHEATFTQELLDRAEATGHSTALEAATVAAKAGARRLLLTHLSARYKETDAVRDEARTVFDDAEVADELKLYEIDTKVYSL